jgi:D-ribose pyranose/furanose isomerase RbsD
MDPLKKLHTSLRFIKLPKIKFRSYSYDIFFKKTLKGHAYCRTCELTEYSIVIIYNKQPDDEIKVKKSLIAQ